MSCQSCCDVVPMHKLCGPKGVWYGIGTKQACSECKTAPMIVIYRFLGDEYLKWAIDSLPPVTFRNINSLDEASFEMVDDRVSDLLHNLDAVN